MVAQPRLRGKSPVTAAARHASLQGRVNGLHFDKRRDDDRSRWGRGTMPIPRSFLARPASLGGNDLGRLDFRWLLAPAQNVIGGDRPVETLQIQVADMRDLYRSLDGAERALSDQDLPRSCFVAQARGEICHAADRRVLAPMFEADLPQCRVARSYTDPESKAVALSAPVL